MGESRKLKIECYRQWNWHIQSIQNKCNNLSEVYISFDIWSSIMEKCNFLPLVHLMLKRDFFSMSEKIVDLNHELVINSSNQSFKNENYNFRSISNYLNWVTVLVTIEFGEYFNEFTAKSFKLFISSKIISNVFL